MSTSDIMKTVSPEQLLGALNWRYATKQFDPERKIPDDVWDALEQALVLAPSSFGLQPWRFLVIDDPSLRARLREASWGQAQLTDAARVVVFAVRDTLTEEDVDRFIRRAAEVRGVPVESLQQYRDIAAGFVKAKDEAGGSLEWNARQAYIALGQFMTSAALMGVDTCPLEGIDPKKYDEILGLAGSGYRTVCACAAGYRSQEDKYATTPKVRYPRQEVVQHL